MAPDIPLKQGAHGDQAPRVPSGMTRPSRIWLLLPAFNEARSLSVLLPRIAELSAIWPIQTIVCDDGSRDGTPDILANARELIDLEIIVHKTNRGLGETIRDLFERVNERCSLNDVIVRMDCDDTHDPSLIGSMVSKLEQGYDVVVASRFQPGGGQVGVDRIRGFLSSVANHFMKLLFPIRGLREYSCAYRAYRASIVRRAIRVYENDFIQLKGLGFTCTLEKLVKLKLLGARFGEVPFVLRYDLKKSASKMAVNITTLGYITLAILYYWPWNGWRNHYRYLRTLEARQLELTPVATTFDARHSDHNGQ
jgi:dolichol-phosphate mannosyltransferase